MKRAFRTTFDIERLKWLESESEAQKLYINEFLDIIIDFYIKNKMLPEKYEQLKLIQTSLPIKYELFRNQLQDIIKEEIRVINQMKNII